MIRAVIIDDEKSSREALSAILLNYCPEVELLGEANTAKAGIRLIRQQKPELIFLDIQMPFGSGFDMLENISDINFDIIFTTAYDQFALKAIKFSALDYLLKPINVRELKTAIRKLSSNSARVKLNKKLESFIENLSSDSTQKKKIVLPSATGFQVVEVDAILRCQADRNYTRVFLKDQSKTLVTKTLKQFEEMLSEYNFFRIHQSNLINMGYVKRYIRGRGGKVELVDGTLLDVSRSKKEEFIKKFI